MSEDAAVCVVVHDCAAARAAGCEAVLSTLREVADRARQPLPLTLLVVPRWHGQAGDDRAWLHRLRTLAGQGHELALHGLTHRDTGPRPRNLLQWLVRRHYTESEGEFAALDLAGASARLAEAKAWASRAGLPISGFVAPAWLMSGPALQAVEQAGFSHTCTLSRILALPGGLSVASPALVYSTRAPWRRLVSLGWNAQLAWRHRRSPLLRLDLHPDDADHPRIRRAWAGWLEEALGHRRALRLSEAALRARPDPAVGSGTPPARAQP